MTKGTRRNHTSAFMAKVALAAVKGEKTLAKKSAAGDLRATRMILNYRDHRMRCNGCSRVHR